MTKQLKFRDELISSIEKIKIPRQIVEYICISEDDAYSLSKIVTLIKPRSVLEIGSYMGISTLFIANLIRKYGTIISIDPNLNIGADTNKFDLDNNSPSRYFYEYLKNTYSINNSMRIDGFFSKVPNKKTSDYHIKYNPKISEIKIIGRDLSINNKFDFVFIDGDHYKTSVFSDLVLVKKMVHDKSIICLHDAEGYWGNQVLAGTNKFISNNLEYQLQINQNLVFLYKKNLNIKLF